MEHQPPKEPRYKTVLIDKEHHTVLMALCAYKMMPDYVQNKDTQLLVETLEKKIMFAVDTAHIKDKITANPERYSDLTFEHLMEQFNATPAPEGATKILLSQEEKMFIKLMIENTVIATLVLQIPPLKMLEILKVIISTYKQVLDKGGFGL